MVAHVSALYPRSSSLRASTAQPDSVECGGCPVSPAGPTPNRNGRVATGASWSSRQLGLLGRTIRAYLNTFDKHCPLTARAAESS